MFLHNIFPLHEPVYIFVVLIGLILFSPYIFRPLKIPDVAAFILAGLIIGPYGLKILEKDASINLLGTIGLLYIMFLAGLELDPEKLQKNKKASMVFGFFTFVFPFALGMFICKSLLHLNFQASLLVSIMFSTHTLIAYPLVRKIGVGNDVAVLAAVGGTIITDTLVLIILSFITQADGSNTMALVILETLLIFGIYLLAIIYLYPKIAGWFFQNIKYDRPVHFLFLLFMVGLAALMAELAGIEAIIGAFVAGLALSKSVPKNSVLMHHVEFVGNILFIPVFLIGIGMMINTEVLTSGTKLWYVSIILVVAALFGKWLAAWATQLTLRFHKHQRNLLFGLSSSHAAATIAVILIGYERGIVDETILNATIIIILISCLTASVVTQKAAMLLSHKMPVKKEEEYINRILVPIANPANIKNLVHIAHSFQNSQSLHPVYVLYIVKDDKQALDNLSKNKPILENSLMDYNAMHEHLKVITRVDVNISSGILRAAKEYMVSDIVFGWGFRQGTLQKLFGGIFEHLENSLHTLYACRLNTAIEEINEAGIFMPEDIEHEPSFLIIMRRLFGLPLKENARLNFVCESAQTTKLIDEILPKKRRKEMVVITGKSAQDDPVYELNIHFYLRKQSISYEPRHNQHIRKQVFSHKEKNFIVVVPGYL